MAQPQPMTTDEDVEIREVQTIRLRPSTGSVVARMTEAMRTAGVEEGSVRFRPDAIDEPQMVLGIGTGEHIDGRTDPLARAIHHEGGATMSINLPPQVLDALGIDPDGIDWDNPPELTVWAGDGILALEPADSRIVTVSSADRGETDD